MTTKKRFYALLLAAHLTGKALSHIWNWFTGLFDISDQKPVRPCFTQIQGRNSQQHLQNGVIIECYIKFWKIEFIYQYLNLYWLK